MELKKVLDIISGDVSVSDEYKETIKTNISKSKSFYSDALYFLTMVKFKEEEAKKIWKEIIKHKFEISQKLGRNIGLRVAALDYLENIRKIIKYPKIVEESEFMKTIKLATFDQLTGLYNRSFFLERLRENFRKKSKFSIALMDLDGFKSFNDKEGHYAGDLMLQEFSQMLKSELEGVVCARYGGDEFVVLLDGLKKEEAKVKLEEMRRKVEGEYKELNITLSCGISEYPRDGMTANEIISIADESLLRAKEFGGNKVIYFKDVELKYSSDENIKEVYCIGDFNRWNKNYGKMEKYGNMFKLSLSLKPGKYRYKFLIDGSRWLADPSAKEFVDDGFGGKCAVLIVEI